MNDKPSERKVVPLRKSRRCPICDKPSDPAHYPFCSDRCQSIDLNRWLSGAYAIPAVEADDDPTGSSGDDRDG